MTFYSDGFMVLRGLISLDEAKRMEAELKSRTDGEMKDGQVMGSPSFYADASMQKKQLELLPIIEKHSGLELFKTYTYARIYKKGDILRIHQDRKACEISITLNLGGDKWDLWLLDRNENPVKVNLNPGDALLYRGCEIWHWRGKFEGEELTQVFMHYVDKYGPCSGYRDDNLNDHNLKPQ